MGPVARFSYEWEPVAGASTASLRFASGAVGTMYLAAGASGTSPLERVEVVGRGANLVVDNGVRLTYYRAGRSALVRTGTVLCRRRRARTAGVGA